MTQDPSDLINTPDPTSRIVRALGLVSPEPGRQIHRDARGRKVSEIRLDQIVLGSVRPSFHEPLRFAIASIESAWRSVVLLADDLVGPTVIGANVAEALVDAWPSPATWAGDGWLMLDGTPFDLTLSTLSARTTLQFSGGPQSLIAVQHRVGGILHVIARESGNRRLDEWLRATSDSWSPTA